MKKILLIEDNEDIRNNTAEILELSNYEVLVADNGKTGVQKAAEHFPDLILCDIMMPVLDGYGVLHAVHKIEGTKNTPFIFITAKTDRSDFRKGMELGADDYITKPFTGTELLNAVDGRLQKTERIKDELQHDFEISHCPVRTNITLESFTAGRHLNHYKKKERIYSEGNHPNRLFYVTKGKVKTYKINDEGKELVTEILCPGDFLGYTALLAGTTYKDSASAIEECELAVISKEEFDELITSTPVLTKKFIQLLTSNVTEKENLLLGMAYNSLRKKIAGTLIRLLEKFPDEKDGKPILKIGRETLATLAGTATESVVRTLTDFRAEKLIDIEDGTIILLNAKKLKELVN